MHGNLFKFISTGLCDCTLFKEKATKRPKVLTNMIRGKRKILVGLPLFKLDGL